MLLDKVVSSCGRVLVGAIQKVTVTPVRTRYVTWVMRRDVKRRALATEHIGLRTRLVALKKSKILPEKIKNDALNQINAMPRDSHPTRATNMCILTGRLRGVVPVHRLSRIMWRLLADYNKMSGVLRAKW